MPRTRKNTAPRPAQVNKYDANHTALKTAYGAFADLRRELADRFGPPPREARHLLDLAELRALCRAAGVARIEEFADRRYRLAFAGDRPLAPKGRAALAAALGGRVGFSGEGVCELDLRGRAWSEIARELARALAAARSDGR